MRLGLLSLRVLAVFVLALFFVCSVRASPDLWSRTCGGAEFDYAYSLVETPDGGFALAVYTFGEEGWDDLLVKTGCLWKDGVEQEVFASWE